MIEFLMTLVRDACLVLTIILFIRVLFSWIEPYPRNSINIVANQLTDPFISPLRRIIPRIGAFDLSPLALFFILSIISRATYYI